MRLKKHFKAEDTSGAKLSVSTKGTDEFVNSAFGLSAHWGIYSLSNHGNEWIYYNDRLNFNDYKKRMTLFNPGRFNANEWGDLLLESNMKFLLITAKHHDGFCMWDTKQTDFKITNTAFGRDVLEELSVALAQRNLKLHFYYSLVDWTHPSYRTDWNDYIRFYQNQLRELCNEYGEIGGIIFDGYWPQQELEGDEIEWFQARGKWDLAGTYDLIHTLQPNAVISNNTHILPLNGEDYQVWELDLPGENTTGFNCESIGDKPLACWWNVNAGWSYQPWNHNLKSAQELYDVYKSARKRGSVFFLNVGPRPYGDIHPDEQAVLRQIGMMIRRNL